MPLPDLVVDFVSTLDCFHSQRTMENLENYSITSFIIESSPGRLSLPLAPEMPVSS
jgi:hypothetical protein